MSIINSDIITSNNEIFTRSDYNGVSILIRNKDNYINATKIAKDNNKSHQISNYLKSEKWKEICNSFKENNPTQICVGCENKPYYVINSEGKCETYGTYIHPDLIHFIAEWCNIDYAFKVSIIMNKINEIKILPTKMVRKI